MSDVIYECQDDIAIVVLNRPKVYNALSRAMCEELASIWKHINANDTLRAVVLTGAGGNFCAGGDLFEMSAFANDRGDSRPYIDKISYMNDAMLRGYALNIPLISAIEGVALAGGTELLQASDIRIAGEGASFGLPEVRHGIVPIAGSTARLARQIPYTKAAELLLTGNTITAREAKEINLIGQVVPQGMAQDKAMEYARRISRNGPLAVKAILQLIRGVAGLNDQQALATEIKIGGPVFDSDDAAEGMKAFVERREPKFSGR